MAPRKKKVEEQLPLSLFDRVKATGPCCSQFDITGRIFAFHGEYVTVVWANTTFRNDDILISLPKKQRIRKEGVQKI